MSGLLQPLLWPETRAMWAVKVEGRAGVKPPSGDLRMDRSWVAYTFGVAPGATGTWMEP